MAHALPVLKAADPERVEALIDTLKLQPHIEGGYFAETDRDGTRIAWPDTRNVTRNASTTIFYFLDAKSSMGAFHRNRGRTVHTLHSGRGRYVLIHADEAAAPSCPGGYGDDSLSENERWTRKARVETFIVGHDVKNGERLQWIVEGGKYKCSYLLPDEDGGETSNGLLISETVVPGFEYEDHDFMRPERMDALVTAEQRKQMYWMLRRDA